ncbi:hypothetical protein [uncultured Stenotrophomonas sp.]|uniref:hypothetical protein n=1 Tax=uncultured Stenotrophomonas sp. TaxID=165438 RepID=UPI0025F9F976|nr:hypothetical protein [uncultured Stenotrophomonas sp.]
MRTKLLAQLIGFVVIVPSTLVALFYSALGLMFALESIQRQQYLGSAALVLACLSGGWLGIVALWRAYFVLGTDQHSFNSTFIWMGFGCGSLVSLVLIGLVNGSLLFRGVFFGWPLLAVAVFTAMLLRRGTRAAPPAPSA